MTMPWRVVLYAVVVLLFTGWVFRGSIVPAFVRADPATAFTWDTASHVGSRGRCYSGRAFRDAPNQVKAGWTPGRGRYILTMLDSSGRTLVRGRLWISDDMSRLNAHPGMVVGYGATDASFAALGAVDIERLRASSTSPEAPGLLLFDDEASGRQWLGIGARGASGDAPLRLEIRSRGGDGFSGVWKTADTLPRGVFCAGWIEV